MHLSMIESSTVTQSKIVFLQCKIQRNLAVVSRRPVLITFLTFMTCKSLMRWFLIHAFSTFFVMVTIDYWFNTMVVPLTFKHLLSRVKRSRINSFIIWHSSHCSLANIGSQTCNIFTTARSLKWSHHKINQVPNKPHLRFNQLSKRAFLNVF